MLIEGEKWACEACVRGHRVSSCTHSDRPLQHINKKGRPVSQCPHCRGLRKARSSHVRCECAEKEPHMKREPMDCPCPHGGKCTCNIKKEHLDPIAEVKFPKPRSRANTDGRKPRLTANNSDPAMTVFSNGHHKPAHKTNHAGHDFAPYKIPRPHSIHGSASLAQRSMDNLTLSNGYSNQNSMFSAALSNLQREDQRLVRSAHGSPGLYPTRFDQFGGLPTLDINFPAYNTSITSSPAGDEYPQPFQTAFESYMSPLDEPPRSAPLNAPAPYNWSAVDLPLDVGALPSTYNQPPSYASFDHSHPEIPNPSSADLSDVEDFTTQGVLSPDLGQGSPFVPSPPEGQFGSTESLQSQPFNPTLDAITMDSFAPQSPHTPLDPHELSNNISPDPEAFTRHGITVQDAQKLAHPGYTSVPATTVHNPMSSHSALSGPPMIAMTTQPTSDPSWAAAYDGSEEDGGYVHPSLQIQEQNWMP